jgi:endonuclease V-like protein UPF0215 family
MVFVAFKADQVGVHQRVLDVFVSEQSHDVEYVFGSGVFCGGFPVVEGVEMDLLQPGVF